MARRGNGSTDFGDLVSRIRKRGDFTFEYTAPWGAKSKVTVRNRGIIRLDFPDSEENIYLEDADEHLRNAVGVAVASKGNVKG